MCDFKTDSFTTWRVQRILIECFARLTAIMLYPSRNVAWFHSFESCDFDIRNEKLRRLSKNFEDSELDANRISKYNKNQSINYFTMFPSDEKNSRSHKVGNPQLTERQMENRKNISEILLK